MVESHKDTFLAFDPMKIVVLGVTSLMLYVTLLLSAFVPFCVGVANLLFERKTGLLASFIICVLGSIILFSFYKDVNVALNYLILALTGIAFSEAIRRDLSPYKVMISYGVFWMILCAVAYYFVIYSQGLDLLEFIKLELEKNKEAIDKQFEVLLTQEGAALEKFSLLKNPEALTAQIKEFYFPVFIGFTIVISWINMFLLYRVRSSMLPLLQTKYNEDALRRFRVPDQYIWGLIISIALYLFGEQISLSLKYIGIIGGIFLGVFYYIHGFSLYISFLDAMRIKGFFRTFLVVLTLMTASYILAVVAVVDVFVNFERFLKKKE